ncbi:MAG: glycosyltransferase family 39 protein [Anaerolineae bacterium]
MPQRLRSEWPIIVLVTIFVVLGLVYSTVVPLWEAPDEPAHFKYIVHIRERHSIPVQQVGALDAAHHPPLYYVIAALVSSPVSFDLTGAFQPNPEFTWAKHESMAHNVGLHRTAETFPYRGTVLAMHMIRLISVAASAATVAFTYAIVRRLLPGSPWLALLASAIVAFNPQFLFIGSSVSPESLGAMTSALALWQLIRAIEEPLRWQRWALTGVCCGVAMLSKSSTIVVSIVSGLLLFLSAIRHRSWRLLWKGALALSLAFLLVSGWYFARNWILYNDPLAFQIFLENWDTVRRYDTVEWPDVYKFFTTQFESYWAFFGWMTLGVPKWIYQALETMCQVSLVGWAIWLWRRGWRLLGKNGSLGLIAVVLAALLQEILLFRAIFTFDGSWYQGRYLFPAIAPWVYCWR